MGTPQCDSPYHPHYRRDSLSGVGLADAAAQGAMTREQLFLEQLPVIQRVIGWVCARRALRGADAEDFASVAKTRLIENDYEVFAKYQGRSTIKTYLTSVIQRIYLDFQVQRFGKWRSSAEARRLGTMALRLEQLLYRDGLSFEEACGVLRSDPSVRETRDELDALRLRLPQRPSRRIEGRDIEPVRPEGAATKVERSERQALADRMFSAIRCSLARLPARDRVFLRLHFQSGLSVADASRALGADQKALYRKKEDVLKRLRVDLEAAGIRAADALELLSTLDWEAALDQEPPGGRGSEEQPGSRPSQDLKTASGGKV
jgi:RNA polymerase sigma factor (sigma-70 family)